MNRRNFILKLLAPLASVPFFAAFVKEKTIGIPFKRCYFHPYFFMGLHIKDNPQSPERWCVGPPEKLNFKFIAKYGIIAKIYISKNRKEAVVSAIKNRFGVRFVTIYDISKNKDFWFPEDIYIHLKENPHIWNRGKGTASVKLNDALYNRMRKLIGEEV